MSGAQREHLLQVLIAREGSGLAAAHAAPTPAFHAQFPPAPAAVPAGGRNPFGEPAHFAAPPPPPPQGAVPGSVPQQQGAPGAPSQGVQQGVAAPGGAQKQSATAFVATGAPGPADGFGPSAFLPPPPPAGLPHERAGSAALPPPPPPPMQPQQYAAQSPHAAHAHAGSSAGGFTPQPYAPVQPPQAPLAHAGSGNGAYAQPLTYAPAQLPHAVLAHAGSGAFAHPPQYAPAQSLHAHQSPYAHFASAGSGAGPLAPGAERSGSGLQAAGPGSGLGSEAAAGTHDAPPAARAEAATGGFGAGDGFEGSRFAPPPPLNISGQGVLPPGTPPLHLVCMPAGQVVAAFVCRPSQCSSPTRVSQAAHLQYATWDGLF